MYVHVPGLYTWCIQHGKCLSIIYAHGCCCRICCFARACVNTGRTNPSRRGSWRTLRRIVLQISHGHCHAMHGVCKFKKGLCYP